MRSYQAVLLAAIVLCSMGDEYPARVVGVSDGDTLTVLKGDRTQVKIRLHGIDAPETGQDFGARAKQAASELAFGRVVTIRERERDRYGRTVAEVLLPDGRSLNREMVGRGLAWWYRKYAPADAELEQAEAAAKAAGRGLWGHPGAVPPWEWRKGERGPGGKAAAIVGNRASRIYHTPGCPAVPRIAERNRVEFATEAEAEAEGYRRGKDCPG